MHLMCVKIFMSSRQKKIPRFVRIRDLKIKETSAGDWGGGPLTSLGEKIPGTVLLSRSLVYSTIAAEVLNCRVREGNGCVNLAIGTG